MLIYYDSYKYVNEWFWHNFTPKEIACKGTGSLLLDYNVMDMLQTARHLINKPIQINSAYRSEWHNARIGGVPLSMHLQGRAFDISLKNHNKKELHQALEQAGFRGSGLNYKTFIHADNGRKRTW